MTISLKFDETAYCKAYTEKYKLDNVWMRDNQKFSYSEFVEDFRYSKYYTDSGWQGRKIIALPTAAWCGIAKVICHLAKAIILCPLGISDKPGIYFKVQIYSAARDLQECFGHILTIFNDKKGRYYVEQANFHKSCYECFLISDVDVRIQEDIRQFHGQVEENVNQMNEILANRQRENVRIHTETLNEFKEYIEGQLSKIKSHIEDERPGIISYKQRLIDGCVNSIKYKVTTSQIFEESNPYRLTNDEINAVLDSLRNTWTGDEYSFLQDLKV